MTYETVLYEVAGDGVASITLNRPERMNAFNLKMAQEFKALWAIIKADDAVRAVVIRAAGERAFCTGVDVTSGWPMATVMPWEQTDPGQYFGPRQNKVWKPVILAVQGMCAGGAFYWVNEADIVICSEDATFFDPHVTFGMTSAVEPVGATAHMPLKEVIRITLMGNDERVSAETALRISLVTEITSRERLWDRAHEIAALIAAKPAVAIQGSLQAIWTSLDMPHAAGLENAVKYVQMGNPVGMRQVDRATQPKAKWTLR